MATPFLQARVIYKVATEAEWETIELEELIEGEFYVYHVDGDPNIVTNIKIGDGVRQPKDLPYMWDISIRVPIFGNATPASTPNPASGNGFWFAGAGTYTNYGGVVIPANNIGVITRVGSSYTTTVFPIDLQDYAKSSDVVSKNDLFGQPVISTTNLVTAVTTGVWSQTANENQITSTTSSSHSNTFSASSGQSFFVRNYATSTDIGAPIKLFNSSGGNLGFVQGTSLFKYLDGYLFTLPSNSSISRIGVNVRNADLPLQVYSAQIQPSDKINGALIPVIPLSNTLDDIGLGDWDIESMLKDDFLVDEFTGETGSVNTIYGNTENLSTFTTSTATNLRIHIKPVVNPGLVKRIQLWCINPGILKFRFFKNNGGGSYTCTARFDCTVIAGLNTLVAGDAFDEFTVGSGDLPGFYFGNTGVSYATIGYKNATSGISLGLTGGADVGLGGTVSGFTNSAADFGLNFTVNEFTGVKKVISRDHLPFDLVPDISEVDPVFLTMYNRGRADKLYAPKQYALLVGGQSNAEGRIPQSQLPQWFIDAGKVITGANFCRANFVGTFANYTPTGSTYFGFELYLYKSLLDYLRTKKSDPSYQIWAIKHAVVGTPISPAAKPDADGFWTPFFEQIPTDKEAILKTFERRIKGCINGSSGGNFDIRAFVWHQGESDQGDPDNYYQNLKNLIWYVRGVINNPKLPFIIGGINTSSTSFNQKVQEAKIKLAQEDPYAFYVEVANGSQYLNADSLHWNSAGGQDFATKVFNIIKDFEPRTDMNGGFNA